MTETELYKWRVTVDLPRINKLIAEFKYSREGRYDRLLYLYDKLIEKRYELFDKCFYYERVKDEVNLGSLSMLAAGVKDRVEEVKKIEREIYNIETVLFGTPEQNKDRITNDMIDRAREYPIEQMLDVKKGASKCISGKHNDETPSMDVRNNFCYCYACGWSADSIEVAKKIYGLNFIEAVKRLQ